MKGGENMLIRRTKKNPSNKDNKEKKIVVKCGGQFGTAFNDC